ncbi:MAG: hypothetical protein P1U74_11440 [Legionellaceae bacterium]|nr:hypothetical protein [Legionellaceae bacterium]
MGGKKDVRTLREKLQEKKVSLQNKTRKSYTSDSNLANLAFKAGTISLAISGVIIPLRIAHANAYPLKSGDIRLPFFQQLSKSMKPGIISGQQRGAVSVSSKHLSKNPHETEVPDSSSDTQKKSKTKCKSPIKKVADVWGSSPLAQSAIYSQLDLMLSGYHTNKMTLEARNIQIPRSPFTRHRFKSGLRGVASVMKIGYGYNTMSGFVTFASILHISAVVKVILPESIQKHEAYGEVTSGAFAGAISAVVNFPINHLGAKAMNEAKYCPQTDTIVSPSTLSIFKQQVQVVKSSGIKESAKEFCLFAIKRPLPINIVQSMLIVGMLSGLNNVLGEKPLDDIAEVVTQSLSK